MHRIIHITDSDKILFNLGFQWDCKIWLRSLLWILTEKAFWPNFWYTVIVRFAEDFEQSIEQTCRINLIFIFHLIFFTGMYRYRRCSRSYHVFRRSQLGFVYKPHNFYYLLAPLQLLWKTEQFTKSFFYTMLWIESNVFNKCRQTTGNTWIIFLLRGLFQSVFCLISSEHLNKTQVNTLDIIWSIYFNRNWRIPNTFAYINVLLECFHFSSPFENTTK